MKPENPDEGLLEHGLAAWDVPEPPPGLTDRILAQNAEALATLSTSQASTSTPHEPPALEPSAQEDTPTMLPTDLRPESSSRPFWTATALGFAAAAAIVLAFMAGRQSSTAPVAPVVPNVEVQVTAPAPVALPPVPPAPPSPPALPEKITVVEETEPVPDPPEPPRVRGTKRRSGRNRVSPDLKNPFENDAPSGDLESPFEPDKGATKSEDSEDGATRAFKNPFESGEATLRVGTTAGSAPAEVSVDGRPVGKTPLAALKVSPGKHTLVFQWPDSRRVVTIDVEADEVKVVRAGEDE